MVLSPKGNKYHCHCLTGMLNCEKKLLESKSYDCVVFKGRGKLARS
jgi:hypothetical protein